MSNHTTTTPRIRTSRGAGAARRLALIGALAAVSFTSAVSAAVVRQPYLQMGTETTMTIVWRTDVASDSRVRYGTAFGVLTQQATNAVSSVDHVVTITNLVPGTRYWYDVGSTTAVHAGGTNQHYFDTSPAAGSADPFRVWVLGDSGTATTPQLQVRNAMLSHTGANPPDLLVHVGDIAYDAGTEDEFTQKHFAVYQDIMRHTMSWHTLGNHEGYSTVSGNPGPSTGPYYTAFTLPMAGEAGGVPSGTEAYYSFDYANTHFICLNSTQVSRSATGTMAAWLEDDLAATSAQWVVAFWHHPPYSKGTHNSDTEIELIQMRENLMPILEAGGVDLVLNGHSHAYERSYLIDGTYSTPTPGFATLLGAGHILDDGDGRPSGDGAYLKSAGRNPREGEVVVVAGHGGASTGGSLNHPVMFHSESAHGSVVLDIDATSISAVNVRYDGVVTDSFTILKGDLPPRVSQADPPKDEVIGALPSVTVTFTTTVTGVDAGDLTVGGYPATVVSPASGPASVYVFSGFAPPAFGDVPVVLSAGGIADSGNASLLFTGDSWYYRIDTSPPAVVATTPARGASSSLLQSIAVTFSKPVVNVTPDDLLVNGSAATQVTGISGTPGPYTFTGYTVPPPGLVNVVLLADGIQDTQTPSHAFAGDAWTVVLTRSLVINEFLASNNTTVTDENGEYDDYLEIFNPGVDPVDMSGMFLTDVLGFPANYRIPQGVTIPAGGHLVFWCDSQPSQGPLHTNFNLARTGEQIGLYSTEADGILPIDTLTYTTQTTDVPVGRFPDGTTGFVPMPATPNAANTISCSINSECSALAGPCTTGVCSSNRCVAQAANEGGSCSTGVACLAGETCLAGVCNGGASTCAFGETCDLASGQCLVVPAPSLPIAVGDSWRYLPGTAEPDPNWKNTVFDDGSWASGASGFGYGPDCNAPSLRGTELSGMLNTYSSLYIRKTFSVPNPALLTSLTLTVDYDDAWVAYLNGVEVARSASMGGTVGVPPAFNVTLGSTNHECSTGSPASPADNVNLTAAIALLQAGNNVLAIQGHNTASTSSDFSIIPSLTATQLAGCATSADCSDGNPCTDDVCGGGICSNPPDNTNLCSDGVTCTADTCSSGVCITEDNCPVGQSCNTGTGQCTVASSTVVFQQGLTGYAGTEDTFVHAGAATADYSAAVTLIVDGPPPVADERQTLLRFDNLFASQGGPIPDGAPIVSATLTLDITNPSATGADLHRMLIPWAETDTWTTLGGGVSRDDAEAAAAADASSLYNGTVPALHAIDVTASVAAWSAGAPNHGWVMVSPPAATDSWQFDSSEGTTAANRPALSVTYATGQTCVTDGDCDDGDLCNGVETCSGSICQPGTPLTCNDGNACTTDTCVPASGCSFANNTSACDDGNACTTGDVCGGGTCAGAPLTCDDGVACTSDSCNTLTGCVFADTCPGGQTCNLGTGTCEGGSVVVTFQQGLSGYAGSVDTYIDAALGSQAGISPIVVDSSPVEQVLLRFDGIFGAGPGQIPPGSTITSATLTLWAGTGTNDQSANAVNLHRLLHPWSATGVWADYGVSPWNAQGGIQNDGADALAAITATATIATAGTSAALDVTASVAAWSADPSGNHGWVVLPTGPDGLRLESSESTTAANARRPMLSVTFVGPAETCNVNGDCDDNDVCNGVETCSGGFCQAGTPLSCGDANPCTTDTCLPATGCSYANNTNACNDGNACTSGDVCGGGVCGGAPVTCDDGAACTTDSCNALTGCVYTDTCPGGQTCNVGTGTCQAASVQATFQQGAGGYTGSADTFIHAGSPTANNAAVTPLVVDGPLPAAPGDERQILMRFDGLFVSQGGPIPDGATITSATLTLNITNVSPDGAELHRMLVPWADSDTWDSLLAGVARDGIESLAAADAVSFYNGTLPAAHAIDVTSSLAAWSANPAANHGWVFVTPAGLSDSWQFSSAEATTVSQRPRLAVNYVPFTGPRGRIDCSLAAPEAPPGGAATLDLSLANLGGLTAVRGYQTKIAVARTSGTGTVAIGCPGGVLVNETRPDYFFTGQPTTFPVTNCALGLASSSLPSGAVAVGPGAAYLSTYVLDVSSDAVPGSTFEVSIAAFPDTALADSAAESIAFETGPVCTLTISGECNVNAQCDDGNPCTDDVCSAGTCTHPPNTASCEDGNLCTVGDACSGGTCAGGAPVTCDDGNACTDDACQPSTGACVATNDDSNLCSDGDACTPVDACVAGACVAGPPLDCNDGDLCTADACSAGVCSHAPSGLCGVTGTVRYYRNNVAASEPSVKPVPNVGIDASGDLLADGTTDGSGLYAVGSLAGNVSVVPTPKYGSPRVSDHNGAITSFDASLAAQASVLSIVLSANQRIAADVSGNGSVSSFDAAQISQFAVQARDHFDVSGLTGSDWRLLRCDTYADANNQTCGAASYTHAPIVGTPVDDFFAVLYGDISGNWAPVAPPSAGRGPEGIAAAADSVLAVRIREAGRRVPLARRSGTAPPAIVSLEGWSGPLAAGQRREILVAVRDADGILGLDLGLTYDASRLQVVSVEPAGIGADLSTAARESGGSASIAAYGPVPLRGTGAVLKITVEAKIGLGGNLPIRIRAEANEGRIPVKVKGGAR